MIRDILIGILFILSVLLQVSFVQTLGYPLELFPLHFVLGILVLHRANVELGILWFVFSAFALSLTGFNTHVWWAYILIAPIGGFFALKLFVSRSVYALEGFGLLMFTIFTFLHIVPMKILNASFHTTFIISTTPFKDYLLSSIFLVIGLYIAFIFAKFLERLVHEIFLVKRIS